MVSDIKLRSIFNKLPISYYLGKNVRSCVLDENSDNSYYNPLQDKVVISLPMIKKAIENFQDEFYNDEEIESLIRGLLYHELGHVILSINVMEFTDDACKSHSRYYLNDRFKDLFNNDKIMFRAFHNIMNIFEDERIETLLRNSFLNTNFKKNLTRITNIDDYSDTVPLEKFFKIVRFKVGEPKFISRVTEIINKYQVISDIYVARYYASEVCELYADVYESIYSDPDEDPERQQSDDSDSDNDWDDSDNENQSGNGSSSNSSEDNDSANNQNQSSNDGSSDQSKSNSSDNDNSSQNDSDDQGFNKILKKIIDMVESDSTNVQEIKNLMDSAPDAIKELIEDIVTDETTNNQISDENHLKTYINNENVNKDLIDKINKIFNDSKTLAKKNSSAVNSYSGVFDPRSAGREDCRFFVNKSRNGSNKMYSKYNLNLYVDCSGSFQSSERAVNELLYALRLAARSNPNFSLNIATIGDGVHKFDFDANIAFECNQGTALDHDIFPIVKSYTRPDAVNRSIVLIDGDAFECGQSYPECFSAFNSKDFYLIVDEDNEGYIKRYAPNAHTIIHHYGSDKRYEDLLIERVLSALEVLTRV